MKNRFVKHYGLKYVVAFLFVLAVFPFPIAWAAEEVNVILDTCPAEGWATDEQLTNFGAPLGLQPPLTLLFPNGHRDMTIRLHADYSIAFTEDITNLASSSGMPVADFLVWLIDRDSSDTPSGVVKNVYSVQFCDYDGNVVYTEYDAIPNGGSREFFIGANVSSIAVRSWYNTGEFDYIKSRLPGRVYYSNAYEIETEVSSAVSAPTPMTPNTGTANAAPISANNPLSTEKVSQYFWKSNYNKGWYEGEWKNDQPNGWGKLTYDKEETVYRYTIGNGYKALHYEGGFVNGFRSGQGTIVYEGGYRDEGEFFGAWEADKVVFQGKRWLVNSQYNGYWPVTVTATSATTAFESYGAWQSAG